MSTASKVTRPARLTLSKETVKSLTTRSGLQTGQAAGTGHTCAHPCWGTIKCTVTYTCA